MKNKPDSFMFPAVVAFTFFLVFTGQATGAGFAIIEQSGSGAGNAYAGAAAVARDASTIYFNPAGMALQSGSELQVGPHYIIPRSEFDNQGSTTVLGTPLTGDDGGDSGEPALAPNLYYLHSLSGRWKAGLGITAPFGLVTEYDAGWVGRYHALKSDLSTLNINPCVALRINRQWSLGVGVSFQRVDAELTNAIDWGTILVGAGAPLVLSQNLDGKATVKGDDWGIGANIGLIFQPLAGTRIGMHYRSQIDHTLKGEADFDTPPAAAGAAQLAGLVGADVQADITLPETVSISAYHEFSKRWAILADITWTKWSRLEELRIEFASGAADSVTTLDWDDTWRYSLGGIFRPHESLELRAGVAFDQSPIPDATRRTPRIPDGDRTWLALGAGYQINKAVRVDLAYTHIFVNDPRIGKSATGEDRLRGALIGEYDAGVDIISAAVSFRF